MKKRDLKLLEKLQKFESGLCISDVSMYELFYGAENYEDPQRRAGVINDFAERLTVIPFDTDAARHAGNIAANLSRTGQRIGSNDILIAATARARGLVLVTRNLREFNRVEGLRVENWVD
jgi:tRNA(fMet)-specific endonuclease VapC